MTTPNSPRIDLNPSKAQRLDLDSFVLMNLPGKRAGNLRMTFKFIWLAHQISEARYNQKGLRFDAYLQIKKDLEHQVSIEKGRDIELNGITEKTIQKTLRNMRKAGYLRYVPLEDRWYFSGKTAGTLRKMAKDIEEFQKPASDHREVDHMIHEFSFGL